MGCKLGTLLLITVSCYAQWPSPKSATDAYEFVQGRRAEARKLWETGDVRGFAVLNDALAYLDQPLVKDLAAGNRYLAARRSNIYYDFGEAYASQGKTLEALENLKKFADLFQDPSGAKMLEQNRHFDSVRGEPGFQAILAKERQFEHYWDSTALHTPFRDNLPDDEKLAGLSKFWSEVKYNFGYPEKLVELDWDDLYLKTIPKVLATRSTGEYYQEMMRLCALLGDGHTNVYGPSRLNVTAKPPMRTGLVEGHVMILDARSPSLEARDTPAPVWRSWKWMECRRSETRGAMWSRTRALPRRRTARIEPSGTDFFRDPRKDRSIEAARYRGQGVRTRRGAAGLSRRKAGSRRRAANAAEDGHCIRGAQRLRNERSGEAVVGSFPEDLGRLCHHPGCAFERRRSSGIGYEVIRSLLDRPVPGSRQVMRRYNPTDRARGTLMEWTEVPAENIQPREGPHFAGPVAVLIGPGYVFGRGGFPGRVEEQRTRQDDRRAQRRKHRAAPALSVTRRRIRSRVYEARYVPRRHGVGGQRDCARHSCAAYGRGRSLRARHGAGAGGRVSEVRDEIGGRCRHLVAMIRRWALRDALHD